MQNAIGLPVKPRSQPGKTNNAPYLRRSPCEFRNFRWRRASVFFCRVQRVKVSAIETQGEPSRFGFLPVSLKESVSINPFGQLKPKDRFCNCVNFAADRSFGQFLSRQRLLRCCTLALVEARLSYQDLSEPLIFLWYLGGIASLTQLDHAWQLRRRRD